MHLKHSVQSPGRLTPKPRSDVEGPITFSGGSKSRNGDA